jgi:SPP1 gp7 family putative phage head morphogenesis protein
MQAVNTALKTKFEQIGIEQVIWIAAIDDIACEECMDLNGQVFALEDLPEIPVHEGCRCIFGVYVDRSQDEEESEE